MLFTLKLNVKIEKFLRCKMILLSLIKVMSEDEGRLDHLERLQDAIGNRSQVLR